MHRDNLSPATLSVLRPLASGWYLLYSKRPGASPFGDWALASTTGLRHPVSPRTTSVLRRQHLVRPSGVAPSIWLISDAGRAALAREDDPTGKV